MHAKKKALLAAGLIAGTAALTGCTANTTPVATPTPRAVQQQTAEPATAQPEAQASPQADQSDAPEDGESPAPIKLTIGGEEADQSAIMEQEELLLPLVETSEKLGWKAHSEETEEETQTKRVVTLEKEDSRITVAWTVSDNTLKNISWQKDGLLIPVDTRIITAHDTVYVPAAFFEEAMDVSVSNQQTNVIVSTPKPNDTPKMEEDSSGEND
ncbi:MAG: hypothetical protein IJ313_08120 [Clostridia bacterium]|nr:hypothetical protein [Clostridia bacterium]